MMIYGFVSIWHPNGDVLAEAIAADGTVLAHHTCSDEEWAQHDLGMNGRSKRKHDRYDDAYPKGWAVEFVRSSEVETHAGLQAALAVGMEVLLRESP